MSKYREMFDNIEPLRSPAEVAAAVTAERPAKKHSMKPLAAVAAGLAAAMAMTVTVGAASGWDLGGALRAWFGAKAEENVMDKLTDIEVISSKNTFENLDFDFIGAVADDNVSALFVEITRTDGGTFDCAEREVYGEDSDEQIKIRPGIAIRCYRNIYGKYGKNPDRVAFRNNEFYDVMCTVLEDNDPADNKITAVFCVDTDRIKSPDGGNTAVIDLNIADITRTDFIGPLVSVADENGNEYMTPYEYRNDTFSGTMRATVAMTLRSEDTVSVKPGIAVDMKTLSIGSGKTYENGSRPFYLKSLALTSTSVSYELEGIADVGRESSEIDLSGDLIRVVMRNGDSFTVNESRPHSRAFYNNGYWNTDYIPEDNTVWYERGSFMLGRVIDVYNVLCIEIGGRTISF